MRNYRQGGIKMWGPKYDYKDLKAEQTHYLLDGGSLHVPIGKNVEFCALLAQDMDHGIVNYVIETRTPIFRLFIDLDIFEKVEFTVEQLLPWMKQMQKVVQECFPEIRGTNKEHNETYDSYSVLICTAPPKENVEKNGDLWCKTGVHLVWPCILVDAEQAKSLRQALVQWFEATFGKRGKHNIWEDVFDGAVYNSNGLRMIGSGKLENCPTCKGKPSKTMTCDTGTCDGSGKYDTNRVYRVEHVVDGDGNLEESLLARIKFTTKSEVCTTSIRVATKKAAFWKTPKWYRADFFYDEKESHKERFNPSAASRKHKKDILSRMPENIAAAKLLGIGARFPKLRADDEKVMAIQKWIKNGNLSEGYVIPGIYRNTRVSDVTKKMGDKGNYYYLARTDSQFCMNKAGEHNSNSIYFLINERGLYQKCFCQCETNEGRTSGKKCKDYHSAVYFMPSSVKKWLYPELYARDSLAKSSLNQNSWEVSSEVEDILIASKRDELIRRAERLRARQLLAAQNKFQSKRSEN